MAALLIASVLIAFITYHQSQTANTTQHQNQPTTHTASAGSGTTPQAASYIQSAALTTSIDASIQPTAIASTFKVGQTFYLTLNVQPTPTTSNEGVVINWYGNNKLYYSLATNPNSNGATTLVGGLNTIPTQGTRLAMEMRFDQPLTGKVELYWRPPTAKGAATPQLQLEKTLNFTIK